MPRGLLDDLVAALLPVRCAGCGGPGASICRVCASALRSAPPAAPPPGIDWWTACFAYEGVVREVIARAKYRGERAAVRALSAHVAAAVARHLPRRVQVVTWAPASRVRYAHAGVDHASVIARVVARAIDAPTRALLQRADNIPQTGRDARSRRRGPQLVARREMPGLIVLVIDDVATTGGTLASAARALRDSGACRVYAATIARTPRPGGCSSVPAYTSATIAG